MQWKSKGLSKFWNENMRLNIENLIQSDNREAHISVSAAAPSDLQLLLLLRLRKAFAASFKFITDLAILKNEKNFIHF